MSPWSLYAAQVTQIGMAWAVAWLLDTDMVLSSSQTWMSLLPQVAGHSDQHDPSSSVALGHYKLTPGNSPDLGHLCGLQW